MKFKFQFSNKEIKATREIYEKFENIPLVKERLEKNVNRNGIRIDIETLWRSHFIGLLTSNQNSSKGSPVHNILHDKNFKLSYNICSKKRASLPSFISSTLKNHGGIRYYKNIGKYAAYNFHLFEDGTVSEIINQLNLSQDQISERQAAYFIKENLKGFGPKQSRNFLQYLGLTKYEIPIDSRVIKWLNNNNFFDTKLSAKGISNDLAYDHFNDLFIALADEVGIYPCVLDAVIFRSFEYEKKAS